MRRRKILLVWPQHPVRFLGNSKASGFLYMEAYQHNYKMFRMQLKYLH